MLDGKPIRTPSGRGWSRPTGEIADAIAAEWQAQGEFIDPLTMPLTRLANSVVDAVVDRVDAVTEDVAKYLAPICCSTAPAIPRRWWRGRPRIGIRSVLGGG